MPAFGENLVDDNDEPYIKYFGKDRIREIMGEWCNHIGYSEDRQELYPCMFHVLAVIDVDKHVRHLDVHKGPIPSVELKLFEEEQYHTLNLVFSGDMERQGFIGAVCDAKDGEDADWHPRFNEEEDDLDDLEEAKSDEELIVPNIYD